MREALTFDVYSKGPMIDSISYLDNNVFLLERDKLKMQCFHEIFTVPNTTRKSIRKRFRFRSTSVSNAVQDLIDSGLVLEEGDKKPQTKPGRPEFVLSPNYNRILAFSSYVEGRKIKAGIINLGEEKLREASISVPKDADKRFFEMEFCRLAEGLLDDLPAGSEMIGGGVSMLGAVDSISKTWISSTRWPGIRNVDFAEIGRRVGIEITLKRSLDSEFEFILTKRPEHKQRNVVLFNWGTGLGATFAEKGRILSSTFGRFADIGLTYMGWEESGDGGITLKNEVQALVSLDALLSVVGRRYPSLHEDPNGYEAIGSDRHLLEIPVMKRSLGYVVVALTNVFKILYPDVILFLGPFTENPVIFRTLCETFEKAIPEYERNRVEKVVIPNSFRGAIYGNVYSIFRKKLHSMLVT
jgi:transcriptional regulator of PTS gene